MSCDGAVGSQVLSVTVLYAVTTEVVAGTVVAGTVTKIVVVVVLVVVEDTVDVTLTGVANHEHAEDKALLLKLARGAGVTMAGLAVRLLNLCQLGSDCVIVIVVGNVV